MKIQSKKLLCLLALLATFQFSAMAVERKPGDKKVLKSGTVQVGENKRMGWNLVVTYEGEYSDTFMYIEYHSYEVVFDDELVNGGSIDYTAVQYSRQEDLSWRQEDELSPGSTGYSFGVVETYYDDAYVTWWKDYVVHNVNEY